MAIGLMESVLDRQLPWSPPKAVPGAHADLDLELQAVADAHASAEALVGAHARYTYAELQKNVSDAAAALAGLGIESGDRVAFAAGVRPEIVIGFLACLRAGAIWVGINPALAAREVAAQISDCGVSVLVADRTCLAKLQACDSALGEEVHVVPFDEADGWDGLIAAAAVTNAGGGRAVAHDPLAPAAIAYTSGTTGRSKGVVHSRHNLLAAAVSRRDGVQAYEGRPDLRRGAAMGLANLNAMVRQGLTALISGGCLVCVDRRDAAGIVEWIAREHIQAISLPAALLHDLLQMEVPPSSLKSLCYVGNAGSPVSDDVRRQYERKYGHRVLVAYGQTEALTTLTASAIDQAPPPGASGRACGHIEVAIFGSDGDRLGPDEIGEIRARARQDGPWADVWRPMLGYWGEYPREESCLAGGWLHTGDLGRIDRTGQLFVTGRLKDLIVRGGANVYAAEVERAILGHPDVRDVAVVGRPDDRLGERVSAVVETAGAVADTAALEVALRARAEAHLARYKVPDAWAFVSKLPRTSSGKAIKAGLAATHFPHQCSAGDDVRAAMS